MTTHLRELLAKATEGPWFVSGVRFRMNHSEWISINRYDEAKKQDENMACVGYDPRDGAGQSDAALIVAARNELPAILDRLDAAEAEVARLRKAATDLRDDMLERARWNKHLNDGEIVVEAGNGVWFRFNEALKETTK